jgi:hypothetical protein
LKGEADKNACFGWVQQSKRKTIVGETRCRGKMRANAMVTLLMGNNARNKMKYYQDTKIKLHFSHFKVLGPDRETCFRDTPHQCDDLSASLLTIS